MQNKARSCETSDEAVKHYHGGEGSEIIAAREWRYETLRVPSIRKRANVRLATIGRPITESQAKIVRRFKRSSVMWRRFSLNYDAGLWLTATGLLNAYVVTGIPLAWDAAVDCIDTARGMLDRDEIDELKRLAFREFVEGDKPMTLQPKGSCRRCGHAFDDMIRSNMPIIGPMWGHSALEMQKMRATARRKLGPLASSYRHFTPEQDSASLNIFLNFCARLKAETAA